MTIALPPSPQALLLDFDGVIVQSVPIKARGFAEVYRGEPEDKIAAVLAYHQRHGGVSRREKFRHFEQTLFGRSGDEASVERLASAFRSMTHRAVVECAFVEGAREFLAHAHGRVPLHLVSGTPEEELLDILKSRDLLGFFDSVTGAPTTKTEAFRRIVQDGAHDPARLLAVGDALTEFEAARQLGIPFLGIVAPSEQNPFPSGGSGPVELVRPRAPGLRRERDIAERRAAFSSTAVMGSSYPALPAAAALSCLKGTDGGPGGRAKASRGSRGGSRCCRDLPCPSPPA